MITPIRSKAAARMIAVLFPRAPEAMAEETEFGASEKPFTNMSRNSYVAKNIDRTRNSRDN